MSVEFSDFEKLNIRVGEIIEADLIDNAKYSTHLLKINFGSEIGIKKSCARLVNYALSDLVKRRVLAVTNFEPRQIGKHMSEVLVLGTPEGGAEECYLVSPDPRSPLGSKLY